LAFATKFNALFLPIAFALTWRRSAKLKRSMVPLLVGTALLAAISTYGFNTLSVAEDPRLSAQLAAHPPQDAFAREAMHVRIPGYYFLRGFQLLIRDQIGGYHSYFMGEVAERSAWIRKSSKRVRLSPWCCATIPGDGSSRLGHGPRANSSKSDKFPRCNIP
jgi:hypothetical protein